MLEYQQDLAVHSLFAASHSRLLVQVGLDIGRFRKLFERLQTAVHMGLPTNVVGQKKATKTAMDVS